MKKKYFLFLLGIVFLFLDLYLFGLLKRRKILLYMIMYLNIKFILLLYPLAFLYKELINTNNSENKTKRILENIWAVLLGTILFIIGNIALFAGVILIINSNFGEQKTIKVDVGIVDVQLIKRRSRTVGYEIETEKIPELGRELKMEMGINQYKEIKDRKY